MKVIAISQIVIKENRQRQEFEAQALQDLADSIESRGLQNAPVLRTVDDKLILVSGERRIRAMKQIFDLGGTFRYDGQVFSSEDSLIPYTDIGDLTTLEAEEAELDENLKRRDLTWQEHAAAVSRLHKLRQSQKDQIYESATSKGLTPGLLVQSIADTAKEVTGRSDGWYQDQTRKEILVASHLDNEVIAKAKNVDEAFKLLKRGEEQKKNIELAAQVGATFSSDVHRLFNENCLEFMAREQNHGQYDVILTDPPYGMDAQNFGDGGGKLDGIEHHYDDSYESWIKLMLEWTKLSFKIAKPQAHAYVFCDIDNFHCLRDMMRNAGWYVFRTPFIVHKVNSGRVPLPSEGPRRQYEILLYAIKGNKPVTHIYPDVIPCTADDNMTHGAQKPVALFQNLLQRSIRPGDKVIDTFAGTGPIFPAAHALLCEATGIEMNPEYYAISLKRIQNLELQNKLF